METAFYVVAWILAVPFVILLIAGIVWGRSPDPAVQRIDLANAEFLRERQRQQRAFRALQDTPDDELGDVFDLSEYDAPRQIDLY